tara:strand:+ start:78 stop:266 length:189 start_codon:yes stop_codon:yes gene_type:complete
MKPTVSLADLVEIQNAFNRLQSLVEEFKLSETQFNRKLACIQGRVVLTRVMNSLNAEFEVTK